MFLKDHYGGRSCPSTSLGPRKIPRGKAQEEVWVHGRNRVNRFHPKHESWKQLSKLRPTVSRYSAVLKFKYRRGSTARQDHEELSAIKKI